MNSVYGFCGVASNGKQPCLPLASAVTTIGRRLIDQTKAFCEAHVPGSEVIYGDSVAAYTPVWVRTPDGRIDLCAVEDVATRYGVDAGWRRCVDERGRETKEACEMVPGIETWSEKGWTDLRRVVRHALAPHKKMLRVTTASGYVDVTDDHSLLTPQGDAISPKDVVEGTPLMHARGPERIARKNASSRAIDVLMAREAGAWCAVGAPLDATIGVPDDVINGVPSFAEAFWNGFADKREVVRFDNLGHVARARIAWLAQTLGYDVHFWPRPGGNTTACVARGRRVSTLPRSRRSIEVVRVDPIANESGCLVYDLTTENHHFAAGVGNLIVHNTDSVMWNVWPERALDSKTIREAFAKADETCAAIAPIYEHDGNAHIVLEFENVYANYLLLGKKCYSTLQYSADLGPDKPKKTVKKGLKCVRRDTIEHARNSQASCLEHITNGRVPEALGEGRRAIQKLFAGDVPIEHLTTSKKISASYVAMAERPDGQKVKVTVTPHGRWEWAEGAAAPSDPRSSQKDGSDSKTFEKKGVLKGAPFGTCDVVPGEAWTMRDGDGNVWGTLTLAQPHVHVMHMMEKRTPGSGPRVGDRVRYLFVDRPASERVSDLQIARAEDPAYATERNMRPDAVYYAERAVKPPLEVVLSPFVETSCELQLGWKLEINAAVNKARGQASLGAFGFGTARAVAGTSRIARITSTKKPAAKKLKTEKTEKTERDAPRGGIATFFKSMNRER